MMFGSREEFGYFECLSCGTLQIENVPTDLGRHYPANYLGEPGDEVRDPIQDVGRLRRFLRAQRSSYLLGRLSPLGWLLERRAGSDFTYPWRWFRNARVTPRSSILDVGCGPGHLINALHLQGFSNVVGQDTFQQWALPGVTLLRKPLEQVGGTYDLIMLHHSFEHMPNPIAVMQQLKKLCAANGTILIRVPVAGCLAWMQYRENWFQIDAPRHLVIPSVKALQLLARKVGLKLWRVEFDSTEEQFSCSEQYRLGIPLRDARSSYQRKDSTLFTDDEIRAFRDRAEAANASGEGDQACFYFWHSSGVDHKANSRSDV
jgi:SAM-dependent methyltransferase